jgi:hypothetical protein
VRLLSAIFDAVILPVKVAEDVMDTLCGQGPSEGYKSKTRKKIEEIEDDLDE